MKPCVRCHRHVRRSELACPFCAAALPDTPAPPPLAAWSLGALLIACGPGLPPESEDSDDSTGTSTGPAPAETTNITTTDDPPTSESPSTSATGCGEDCSTSFESSAFIYGAPDPGPDLACDPFEQDCPADQKCAAWSPSFAWSATRCVPVTGDQQPGEPCTSPDPPDEPSGHDDCRRGAMCWDLDATSQGTCVALCTGTPEAPLCDPDTACALFNEGVLNLCLPICDPLQPDCGDHLCIADGGLFVCLPDASGDEGQINDPCEFVNNCDPGLVCLNIAVASAACPQGAQGCCQPFCVFPDSPCPNPDQQCIPWFDPMQPIPPGHEDLGVCALPQ